MRFEKSDEKQPRPPQLVSKPPMNNNYRTEIIPVTISGNIGETIDVKVYDSNGDLIDEYPYGTIENRNKQAEVILQPPSGEKKYSTENGAYFYEITLSNDTGITSNPLTLEAFVDVAPYISKSQSTVRTLGERVRFNLNNLKRYAEEGELKVVLKANTLKERDITSLL